MLQHTKVVDQRVLVERDLLDARIDQVVDPSQLPDLRVERLDLTVLLREAEALVSRSVELSLQVFQPPLIDCVLGLRLGDDALGFSGDLARHLGQRRASGDRLGVAGFVSRGKFLELLLDVVGLFLEADHDRVAGHDRQRLVAAPALFDFFDRGQYGFPFTEGDLQVGDLFFQLRHT